MRAYAGWDAEPPRFSRTAADLLDIEACVAAATTCPEALDCTAEASVIACYE